MSTEERVVVERYFWTDRSEGNPLWGAIDRYVAERKVTADEMRKLAEDIGAEHCVLRGRHVAGIGFDQPPPEWKHEGTSEGRAYYLPKKTSPERRALWNRIKSLALPNHQEMLHDLGLSTLKIGGRYVYRTEWGWKDDRAWVVLPFGGGEPESDPKVPAYLTEAKKWEMDRWFDLGRASLQSGAASER